MNIFISGVSSGIGKGLAEKYLSEGAKVFGISRREVERKQGGFHFESLDLKMPLQMQMGLNTLLKNVKQLDLVVLNAGVLGDFSTMREADEEAMKEVMEVNLWAQKRLLDALLSKCEVKQVVAISSGASVSGNMGWAGYSLSKAALNMLVKLYASERSDIHFCALAPGLVDTEMQEFICTQGDGEKFPSLAAIQATRGTEFMPKPDAFAEKFMKIVPELLTQKSGSYLDVRKM